MYFSLREKVRSFWYLSLLLLFVLAPDHAFSWDNTCRKLVEQLNRDSRSTITELSKLRQLEADLDTRSLLDIQSGLTKDAITTYNKEVVAALSEPLPPINTALATEITKAQADLLVKTVANHPVVGDTHYDTYDPDGCIGFCFGRATIAHKETLRRKVHPEAIRKIWAVGSMDEGFWDFHVATIVKGGPNGWWVIDSNYPIAKDIKRWINLHKSSSDDGRLVFFVTDARRFTPYMSRHYTLIDLIGDGQSDFYNSYFRDYLRHTARQPAPEPFN